jgi:hypothetical protein
MNLFGWIPKKLRKLHIITLATTVFSWLVLGYFYGWGYCYLTDLHWDILEELGQRPSQSGYVEYLFQRLLNINVSIECSDLITITGLLFGLGGAVFINIIYPFFNRKK